MERLKTLDDYIKFLKDLDTRLDVYFKQQAEFVCCQKGCSICCEKGDYPLSEIELQYLMEGFKNLDNQTKIIVQQNFAKIEKGGKCPFLIESSCSIYSYRPIICRVHGLAYFCKNKIVKVPYCTNFGLNYSKVFKNGMLETEPISENLDTQNLLGDFESGEIRNLYEWLDKKD